MCILYVQQHACTNNYSLYNYCGWFFFIIIIGFFTLFFFFSAIFLLKKIKIIILTNTKRHEHQWRARNGPRLQYYLYTFKIKYRLFAPRLRFILKTWDFLIKKKDLTWDFLIKKKDLGISEMRHLQILEFLDD